MLNKRLVAAPEPALDSAPEFGSENQGETPDRLIDQLSQILLGKQHQVRLAVACLLAGGHLLIEDLPGVGKTTLAQALGRSLDMRWSRLQFTSDLLPADVVGVSVYSNKTEEFSFKPGPVFTSILLADEINRAPPRAQSALLEAMEERQVTVDGKSWPLAEEFFVIATQNPADNMGAYHLPDSQLDRFLIGIELGYPDPATEKRLLAGGDQRSLIQDLQAVAGVNELEQWRRQAARVHVSDAVLDYVQSLLLATREPSAIAAGQRGLSPRAGLSLLSASRAWALIEGRDMVLPEDVKAVFAAVAGHRLCGHVEQGTTVANSLLETVVLNAA